MLVEPSPKSHWNCEAFRDRLLKVIVSGAEPSPLDMVNSALGGVGVAVGGTAVGVGKGVGVSGVSAGDNSAGVGVSVGAVDGSVGDGLGAGATEGVEQETTTRTAATPIATAFSRIPHPLDLSLVNDVSRAVAV